jgi:hypothetical protein
MNRSKRKVLSHIIDEEANRILRAALPAYWSIRDYKPDYGIDLAIELFDEASGSGDKFDTLGEHLFVQVKGARQLEFHGIKENPPPDDKRGPEQLSVIKFQIETPELVTVQRMGPALPVLLVLIETSSGRIFFVCLNDYIDKILLPNDAEYWRKKTKVIYIPADNELTSSSLLPIMIYAKRGKLYAAFALFEYQNHELGYTKNRDLEAVSKRYAQILLRYDFWQSCDWWIHIKWLHSGLERLVNTGIPGIMQRTNEVLPKSLSERWEDEFTLPGEDFTLDDILRFQDIRTLWNNLANLSRVHEEVCRQWHLLIGVHD